jgi:hypothetical protein
LGFRLRALAFFALGLLVVNSGTVAAVPRKAQSSVQVQPGKIIFQDDFRTRKGGWNTGSDSQEAAGYSHGNLFVQMKQAGHGYSSLATKAPAATNMLVEVTARNVTGHPDTRFGVNCRSRYDRKPPHVDIGYIFSMYNDGSFGIERSDGKSVKVLTRGQSSKIAQRRSSYRIGANCVGSRLTLIVDGKSIASTTDSTYSRGRYGLFIWIDPSGSAPATVRYTDFVVRQSK